MKTVIVISQLDICKGNSAASARIINIAKSLSLSGVQVFLCSSRFSKNLRLDNKKKLYEGVYAIGEENTCKVKNKVLSKLHDIYNLFSFIIKINKLSKENGNKVVLYIYPSGMVMMDILSLLYLKLIRRHKIYYEANEVRLFSLYNRSFSENPLKKMFELLVYIKDYVRFSIAEKLTRYYDGLVVISTNIEKYYYVYNKKLLRIPILADTIKNPFCRNKITGHAPGEIFTICFTGMLVLKKEGFDLLYKALSIVNNNNMNFELHLYGPVVEKERCKLLSEMPNELGLGEQVYYHGVVDQECLIEVMQRYHLLILPRPLTPQTNTGFSTKLSEYMVSGVPVLVTDVSDNALYIKDRKNGYLIPAGNPEKMAEKILEIMNETKESSIEIAEKAFETAKNHFDYSIYSERLSEFIN